MLLHPGPDDGEEGARRREEEVRKSDDDDDDDDDEEEKEEEGARNSTQRTAIHPDDKWSSERRCGLFKEPVEEVAALCDIDSQMARIVHETGRSRETGQTRHEVVFG